jgi:hypothetical protein
MSNDGTAYVGRNQAGNTVVGARIAGAGKKK